MGPFGLTPRQTPAHATLSQDYVKLEKWEYNGYHDLKITTERAQRKLHKCNRQAVAAAMQPVSPLLARLSAKLGITVVQGLSAGLAFDAIRAPQPPADAAAAPDDGAALMEDVVEDVVALKPAAVSTTADSAAKTEALLQTLPALVTRQLQSVSAVVLAGALVGWVLTRTVRARHHQELMMQHCLQTCLTPRVTIKLRISLILKLLMRSTLTPTPPHPRIHPTPPSITRTHRRGGADDIILCHSEKRLAVNSAAHPLLLAARVVCVGPWIFRAMAAASTLSTPLLLTPARL